MIELRLEDFTKCMDEYDNCRERIREINNRLDEFLNVPEKNYDNDRFQKFLQITHDVNFEAGYLKGIEKVLTILGFEITK